MAKIKKSARHKLLNKKESPYNNGQSINNRGVSSKHIAYTHSNYIITKPYIDKITICGNPPNLTRQELSSINTILFFETERMHEGGNPDCSTGLYHVSKNAKGWIKSYKNHYTVSPPGTDEYMTFFFDPKDKKAENQRFLRMEFNPRKMGKENVEWLINWYNETMGGHSRFKDLVSVENCINRIDIAVDIVGVHIADLILNENKGKTNEWHSAIGLLETCYLGAKKDKASKVKIYNKAEEDKNHPYGKGEEVTRIETTVKNPKGDLIKLFELQNKFKNMKIYHLQDLTEIEKHFIPEGDHNLKLFLDSVRFRGRKDTIKRLPRHLHARYMFILDRGLQNIFKEYNETNEWRKHFGYCLSNSGLLSDF